MVDPPPQETPCYLTFLPLPLLARPFLLVFEGREQNNVTAISIMMSETIVHPSPVDGGQVGQVGHEARAAGAIAARPNKNKVLGGARERDRGCSMRGVSTGVVAAAYTVCQREIMGRSRGGLKRERGTTGSVSTVQSGWRCQPPGWWAAQRPG